MAIFTLYLDVKNVKNKNKQKNKPPQKYSYNNSAWIPLWEGSVIMTVQKYLLTALY